MLSATVPLPHALPRLLRGLLLAAGAAALAASAAGAPPPRPGLEAGFGVTPGGLFWSVEPGARRLVLRDLSGPERAAFPLGDEGHVLGVDDSGARVTAPTPDGLRRRPGRAGDESRVEARYVFRFADGSVRATVGTSALRGSEPAVLGEEVFLLRREAGRWAVVRVAPEGESLLATVPEAEVRRRVGRVAAPRLFAGPEGVAVLFPGARADALARLDRAGTLVVPDPVEACGEGRPRLVLPHPEGLVRVSVRTAPSNEPEARGEPLAVAELFDAAGRLARAAPLGPWGELLPLPGGGLLGLDGIQAARYDDRFAEVARGVLPLEEGTDPALAARIVEQLRRMDGLGARASGADWAELALLPGAPAARYLERAHADAAGVLERLARVGDQAPEALEAGRAVALLLEGAGGEERAELLARLRERVEAGGPAWLRRASAPAFLEDDAVAAPAWALPAVAEAIAAGAPVSLPDSAYSRELAELVTAVDRARIERIEAERPELAAAVLGGGLDETLSGSFDELRFHAPASRFPRVLLDCAAGPPSAVALLALTRVAEAALEAAPSSAALSLGAVDADGAAGVRGELAAALLEARLSPDAGLRAAAHALGPVVGIPLDAGRFRADVLRRPQLATFAVLGLVADRGLPEKAWLGLFGDLFLSARASSRNPSACTLAGGADREAGRDRYCSLFAIVQFAALDLGDDEDPAFVSRERVRLLAEFARSPSAPPELRLELKLARALRGTASEEEVVEVLGERELAPVFRRIVLGRVTRGSAGLSATLERELASGRVAPGERGAWLDALVRLDPAAGDRVAAEAWARGAVPLDADEGEAGAWARALDPERVRASEALRAALRRAREVPSASLEAAEALARAGDPGSAGALATALLESCPACLSAADLAELFGPLGEEGTAALARLAEGALPFGVSPLEALFELDAARAGEIGATALDASLERGCVPEPLLPALLAGGIDPFPALLGALEERGCDRTRLKPGEPVAAGIARASGTDTGRAARLARDAAGSRSCRDAFAALLGLPAKEEP